MTHCFKDHVYFKYMASAGCISVANHNWSYEHARVHTTLSLQKVITFYDYFSKNNYDFFMTSAIFLCRGLMFSND